MQSEICHLFTGVQGDPCPRRAGSHPSKDQRHPPFHSCLLLAFEVPIPSISSHHTTGPRGRHAFLETDFPSTSTFSKVSSHGRGDGRTVKVTQLFHRCGKVLQEKAACEEEDFVLVQSFPPGPVGSIVLVSLVKTKHRGWGHRAEQSCSLPVAGNEEKKEDANVLFRDTSPVI